MNTFTSPRRRVQSFVRRDGRMTDAQRTALKNCWPVFGLQSAGPVDFTCIFNREAPRILEIGFGSGHSLLTMAQAHPEQDFIGIETHQPGIGTLLLNLQLHQVKNTRIFYADAVDVLSRCIGEKSLDIAQIFFPDPWPKRRHHKRRLIQPDFIRLLTTKLKPGGTLHLATDWQDYALHMMKVLTAAPELINLSGEGKFAKRSSQRPVITKFEQRGTHSGHAIWELQFICRT